MLVYICTYYNYIYIYIYICNTYADYVYVRSSSARREHTRLAAFCAAAACFGPWTINK